MKILLEAICVVQAATDCGIVSDRIHNPENNTFTRGVVTHSKELAEMVADHKGLPGFYIDKEDFLSIWNSPRLTFNIEYIVPKEPPTPKPKTCEASSYNIYFNGDLVEFMND